MTITVTLEKVNIPIPPPGYPAPTVESVDVLVYDSVSTNLWRWTQGNIPLGTPLSSLQALADANADALYTALQANHEQPLATGDKAIQLQWIAAHRFWKKTFLAAKYTLENGFLSAATLDLAAYRTVLQATLTVLAVLPTPFQSEFTKERTARSTTAAPITGAVSGFTLAACQLFHDLLRAWLVDRACEAIIADHIDDWLNGG